jgi:ribonuclease P protein component
LPTPKKYGFGKEEKLKSRKKIAQLFETKKSVFKYPIKCIYLFDPLSSKEALSIQVTSICPKRNFKKAVDRNRIKRRIREAYRLNKSILFESKQLLQLDIALIYVGKTTHEYHEIEQSIINILTELYSLYPKS